MTDLRPFSEIADGIHWVKDSYVNLYLIESGDDIIMVDSGLNKKAKNVMRYIRSELEDRRISKIYLTHHHADHIGGLHYLHDHFHTLNYAHPVDAEVIRGDRPIPYPRNKLLWPLFAILKPFVMPKRVSQIEMVKEGDVVDGMEVYHLPGHTMGSLGFLKDFTMFAGDTAVTMKGLAPGNNVFAENPEAVLASFKKLSTLDFEVLLSGHGDPILSDASMRVKDAVERLGL